MYATLVAAGEAAIVNWLLSVVDTPLESAIEAAMEQLAETYWQAEYDRAVTGL
ncbi:hypothetical protein QIH87_50090 (plasmid) [Bradyrhizobium elkanii]|uniref:hypothetical protein n=1 Tax=Bradyrhizobium elkanii TaxID=29448 RepID=UPI0027148A24|nr:hypothetical protein [Bradyrhizobium elkanii]WLB14783.1 hypothetical protein QIH87_50090 [Bradyrhizobium elkanii]WLB69125.1 hypothetical protein QIH89_27825 [Bradyrhizobium elkanii]